MQLTKTGVTPGSRPVLVLLAPEPRAAIELQRSRRRMRPRPRGVHCTCGGCLLTGIEARGLDSDAREDGGQGGVLGAARSRKRFDGLAAAAGTVRARRAHSRRVLSSRPGPMPLRVHTTVCWPAARHSPARGSALQPPHLWAGSLAACRAARASDTCRSVAGWVEESGKMLLSAFLSFSHAPSTCWPAAMQLPPWPSTRPAGSTEGAG